MADSIYFELSDDEIFEQLSGVSRKDFLMWNSTSLRNLFVACSGFNGQKIRIQAINLLMDYQNWYKGLLVKRPPWVISYYDRKPMKFLEKMIDYIQKNSVDTKDVYGLRNFQKNFGSYDEFCELF